MLQQLASQHNPIRNIWGLGYHRLCSVLPPDAEVSEHTTLHRRMLAGEDPRGKAPGRKGRDGKWFGYDFTQHDPIESDLDAWLDWGAGVGIKCGDGLVAVDIDTTHKPTAKLIYDTAQRVLGPANVRFGNRPKALLLYAISEDVPYRKLRFGTETEAVAHIELITQGKQFVAYGTHPKTGKPYLWPEGVPARSDLTTIRPEDLNAFFTALAEELTEPEDISNSGADRALIDQDKLRGKPELVASAMRDMPNRDADFPTRDHYLAMGYALKAAHGPDFEDEALDLFQQWAGRWQRDGERNDPDVVEADWGRMKPPFAIGADYIYDRAESLTGWTGRAQDFFEPQALTAAEGVEIPKIKERKRIELLTDEDLQTRPDPAWLIHKHIPQDGVGILYGEPGAGKSFVALDIALHIAAQAETWHGEEIKSADRGAVLYIAGEGAGDFKTRVAAWKKQNFMPGAYVPKSRFRAILDPLDFRSEEDVKALIDAIKEADLPKLSIVVIDTVARATPGADENSSLDMGLFIRACDAVRVLTGAFVLAVHHPNKNGGMRGSTALLGAADVVYRFERKKGQFYGRLKCEKMKAGKDDFETPFRLDVIELGPDVSSLVPTRVEETEIKKAVCDEATEQSILEAVQRAWDDGAPWSMAAQARDRYAPRIVAMRWGVAAEVAQQWLDLWLHGPDPVLEVAVYDQKRKYKGLRPVKAGGVNSDATSGSGGVFD